MACLIPQISIHLAPVEDIPEEPRSPFSPSSWTVTPDSGNSFRPQHLSPISAGSPSFAKVLSPLRPLDSPIKGAGLERQRFEAMLKASKERSSATGARKAADLRKAIALKAHNSKQAERRALFLSKLQAPPSPSAAATPKTPPESPSVFHYTLPSPGLDSPLSLFDAVSSAGMNSVEPWVEEVDFRHPKEKPTTAKSQSAINALRSRLTLNTTSTKKALPSLDQITAHLSSHGQMCSQPRAEKHVTRLPAFLRAAAPPAEAPAPAANSRRPLPIGVGRLQMPIRALPVSAPKPMPKTDIPTIVVAPPPHPTDVFDLASRTHKAKCMLSTLRRRTQSYSFEVSVCDLTVDDDERKDRRRMSSPAEMQQRQQRSGFMHPVLALPGGF